MSTTRNLISSKAYFAVIEQRTLGTGFFDDACREFYLRRLLNCQHVFRVKLHAYLLLRKELFLVFTPLTPSGFNTFVRFLNKSYSRYYSIRFARTVSVWRDEPAICRLPSERLVLDCQKFVEIDSGRECHPGKYRDSSYCSNAFTIKQNDLRRHRAVERFITMETVCLQRYRDFIASPFRAEYARFLKSRLLSGRPLLDQKTLFRLEKNGSLTDIQKNGTMVVIQ